MDRRQDGTGRKVRSGQKARWKGEKGEKGDKRKAGSAIKVRSGTESKLEGGDR